jgi:hypothetical protein
VGGNDHQRRAPLLRETQDLTVSASVGDDRLGLRADARDRFCEELGMRGSRGFHGVRDDRGRATEKRAEARQVRGRRRVDRSHDDERNTAMGRFARGCRNGGHRRVGQIGARENTPALD